MEFLDEGEWLQFTDDRPDLAEVASGARDLELELHCPICCELLRSPVQLACHHVFCSECVRGALNVHQRCPTCRESASTNQLTPLPVLGTVTEAFVRSRSPLLRLLKRAAGELPESEPATTPRSSKRKRPNSSEDEDVVAVVPARLPLLSYHLLKDKDLKAKLTSVGLPITATATASRGALSAKAKKDVLVARHRKFVEKWNAQVDGGRVPSAAKVAREVVAQEQARERSAQALQRDAIELTRLKEQGLDSASGRVKEGFARLTESLKQRQQQQSRQRLQEQDEEEEDGEQQQDQQDGDPKAAKEIGKEETRGAAEEMHEDRQDGHEDATAARHCPPTSSEQQPDTWRVLWSSPVGRRFYFNERTLTGQWEPPASQQIITPSSDANHAPVSGGGGGGRGGDRDVALMDEPVEAAGKVVEIPATPGLAQPQQEDNVVELVTAPTVETPPLPEPGAKRRRSEGVVAPCPQPDAAEPPTWACAVCTFLNAHDDATCAVCAQGARPVPRKSARITSRGAGGVGGGGAASRQSTLSFASLLQQQPPS